MEQRSQLALEAEPGWARTRVLIPILALVSLGAGSVRSFSIESNVVVLGVGGSLLWLGMSRAVVRRPAPRRLPAGTVWWLLPVLMLTVVELTNFTIGSTYEHPTLSKLTDPLLTRYTVRSAMFFGWSAAFLALARR
jgi:hypothetical protein